LDTIIVFLLSSITHMLVLDSVREVASASVCILLSDCCNFVYLCLLTSVLLQGDATSRAPRSIMGLTVTVVYSV